MRLVVLLALAALALTVPLAQSGSCVPACDAIGHNFAFAPPVTYVDSGSWVTWHSFDGIHTASDADYRGAFCFNAEFTNNSPGRAYFAIFDGALYAMSEGDLLLRCDGWSATALPDGSFALEYTCIYHNRMSGTLLIR